MLTIDAACKVVKVARKPVAMTAAEKAAQDALIQTQTTAVSERALKPAQRGSLAARTTASPRQSATPRSTAVPKVAKRRIAFRAWRSLWGYAYEKLALMLAGGREQPTVEAFLLELPAQELPA